MRYIDDIIHVVKEHPHISEVHKQILITRLEKHPSQREIREASNIVEFAKKTKKQ